MGKPSRDKGARFERRVAKMLGGSRVPLSGAVKTDAAFRDDVIDLHGDRYECKVRARGFSMLYRWIEDTFALVIAADREEPLVVLRMSDYQRLIGVRKDGGEPYDI